MPNKKKKKNEPISEEKRQYLRQYRQQAAENAQRKEAVSEALPDSRLCKAKGPHMGCPVCPGSSTEATSSTTVPLIQQSSETSNTAPLATTSAIRSRPILQARRFSYHHRRLSLTTQRRPQSLGNGLRQGLFRRQRSTTLPQHTEAQTQQHSASKLKLSTYLRRAKHKFRKTNTHVPLIRRPIGNRIFSCILLEKSAKQLACGDCGEKDLILEENSNRYGWATYIRWKCRKCEFATDWTSSSPRVSPKGAFEVSTKMYYYELLSMKGKSFSVKQKSFFCHEV